MLGPSQNSDLTHPDLPPLRPVFGVSLDDLLKRDGSAIPLVVYQCLQAVDLFGLDVEGIYRLSGSAMHVSKLRAIFDNGWLFLYEGLKTLRLIVYRFKSGRLPEPGKFLPRCQQRCRSLETIFPRPARPTANP